MVPAEPAAGGEVAIEVGGAAAVGVGGWPWLAVAATAVVVAAAAVAADAAEDEEWGVEDKKADDGSGASRLRLEDML